MMGESEEDEDEAMEEEEDEEAEAENDARHNSSDYPGIQNPLIRPDSMNILNFIKKTKLFCFQKGEFR